MIKKKKKSFRPHAEHIVRRRGPGGTVLSNNICAIHLVWDKEGTENRAQCRAGRREEKDEISGR